MNPPASVQQYFDAQWWMFVHWSMPLILIGIVVAGVVKWVYERYYDN
jgi:hypothetical protein